MECWTCSDIADWPPQPNWSGNMQIPMQHHSTIKPRESAQLRAKCSG